MADRLLQLPGLVMGLSLLAASSVSVPAGTSVAAERAATDVPRLALLVGVGKYPQTGPHAWRPLNTHADVTELRQVLIDKHGFAATDVLVLEDDQATATAIRAAFEQHLIQRARRGAVVFFHFSGHGQQLVDRDGDEADGLDESIVPGDAVDQRAPSAEHVNIRDDQFKSWIKALSQRMRGASGKVEGSIVLSFDTCFSGTMGRGDLVERGRGWDDELDGARPSSRSASGSTRGLLDLDPAEYIVLSATQSNQTAKERAGMGIFSRALVDALATLPRDITYQELMHEVTAKVIHRVTNQTPELEGDPARTLFGAASRQRVDPQLAVLQVRGDEVQVSVGQLHLVTAGSVYELHRPHGPMDSSSLLAEATVVRVEPTTSWLRLLSPWQGKVSETDQRAARVREKEHVYTGSLLRVRLEGTANQPALLSALNKLGLLKWVEAADPDCDLKLVLRRGSVKVLRPESAQPIASVPLNAQAAKALATRLHAEWRWLRLKEMRATSPLVQVSLRIVPVAVHRNALHQVDQSPQPDWSRAGSRVRLPEGAAYQLELSNASPAAIFVTVLELGPDGSVAPLFPDPQQPGDSYIAAGSSRLMDISYLYDVTAPSGTYVLKVIATDQRANFSLLAQEAGAPTAQNARLRRTSLRAAAGTSPLSELPLQSASGKPLRSERTAVPVETWSVTEAYLEAESAKTTPPITPRGRPRT